MGDSPALSRHLALTLHATKSGGDDGRCRVILIVALIAVGEVAQDVQRISPSL